MAYNNLAATLQDLGQLLDAEACYRQAIRIQPDFAMAMSNLGNTLKFLRRLPEAIECYRRALEIQPDCHEAHSNLVFNFDLVEGATVEEQQAERRRWYEQHGRKFAAGIKPHGNDPDPARKLRIGFVSADFRRHSAYYAFSPVILHLDRSAFEVFCYSEG
jgi:predicted O-linked N-acetylglucosamine transferase (SPINDLY family)